MHATKARITTDLLKCMVGVQHIGIGSTDTPTDIMYVALWIAQLRVAF